MSAHALKSSIFCPSIYLKEYVWNARGGNVSTTNEARARAEASFKRKEEQARQATKAWIEYEAERRAVAEKTERLRALRLAKKVVETNRKTDDDWFGGIPKKKRLRTRIYWAGTR